MNFLREYWPWILAPIVVLLLGILVLAIIGSWNGDSEFMYDLV